MERKIQTFKKNLKSFHRIFEITVYVFITSDNQQETIENLHSIPPDKLSKAFTNKRAHLRFLVLLCDMIPGPEFKFSKTVKARWSCYDLQLCQREIATDEIQEKKL